jgi:hypothetical protein
MMTTTTMTMTKGLTFELTLLGLLLRVLMFLGLLPLLPVLTRALQRAGR